MINLVIDNSYSNITGLTVQQEKQLRKALSYDLDPKATYFSGSRERSRCLLGKKGDFPTGLLYLVIDKIRFIDANIVDRRVKPESLTRSDVTFEYAPYPEQIEAGLICKDNHRGIVVAPTGVGKSIIAGIIIDFIKVNTLIVVPNLELARQLTQTMSTIFGSKNVGKVSDKKYIAVENIDALDAEKPLAGYDCVIIDEFHHAAAKTYRILNKKSWKNVYYRFGLTATPFRSQDNERLLLESVLSQTIYRMEYENCVNSGYIVPLEAYYKSVPVKKTTSEIWSSVYRELVVHNAPRNKIIATMLTSLSETKVPTLCLVKEIEHGEILSKQTGVAFASGEEGNVARLVQEFNEGYRSALIGTIGVLGEGVDTKRAEYIIVAGLGKSKNQFMQSCGRGFRTYLGKESCKVVLFKDTSHRWTKAHYAAQVKILKEEYGVIPAEIG